MDDEEECVDVGHAFLDLQELLLTGNDVIEQQIDSRCCICMIFLRRGITKKNHFKIIYKIFHTIALIMWNMTARELSLNWYSQ